MKEKFKGIDLTWTGKNKFKDDRFLQSSFQGEYK